MADAVVEIKEGDRETYYLFLDNLREIGCCNMFGATPYLKKEFPELDTKAAQKVLGDWMTSFDERHPD
jgi:hypothetical protein